ncbi:MAG: aspartyl/asparaginyl beta-hydroxylase domain-containing protein [Hyphomonadaceae bacterium]|nr:aspartyl/asparaginyl beta-hydroxylase domain-containing protein [Hyphomonadaceae bacterium]
MMFAQPYRDLGEAAIAPLRDLVLAQPPEAWDECDHRQRAYDVHHDTQSIVLLFCDDAWPQVAVARMPGWARLAAIAAPLMDEIITRCFTPGGTILRAMAAKLKAGGRIAPHVDALPSFCAAHRIHAPLTTGPGVRFTIDGRPCPMQVGRWYEINNQLPHSVMNVGREDRINFIFDYLPPR